MAFRGVPRTDQLRALHEQVWPMAHARRTLLAYSIRL